MHCFNSLIRPLKFNKRHLTANSRDLRVLIEIWGTPEHGVSAQLPGTPQASNLRSRAGPASGDDVIHHRPPNESFPKQQELFSSVLRHVMSLTFYSFLGFLLPHLLAISTVKRGGGIPKGNECVGQQAILPRALCQCARVQHSCNYRKPECKPGEGTLILRARTTELQSAQAIGCIWTKSLGQHGKQICTEHTSSGHSVAPAVGSSGHKQGHVCNSG